MSIDKSGARKRNQFRRVQLSILLLSLISLQLVAGPRRRSPQADIFPDGTTVPEWVHTPDPVILDSLGPKFVLTEYGIFADGNLHTEQIQALIDKAAAQGGGVIVVPAGLYRTGALHFKPRTHLHLMQGAILQGSDFIGDYPLDTTRIEGETCLYFGALINADHVDGFTISGSGTIDGNGLRFSQAFWLRRRWNRNCLNKDEQRPRLLYVSNSCDVRIQDVRLQNSPYWTSHFYRCENLRICGVSFFSLGSPDDSMGPSTDAIDLDVVRNVHISHCHMEVNDDAISMKGGKGPWADDPVRCPGNGANIEVGDVVTVQGPKTTYNGVVELVDATFVSVKKSLVKVYNEDELTGPKEGGELVVKLQVTGSDLKFDVKDSWMGVKNIYNIPEDKANKVPALTAVVLSLQPNEAGLREGTVEFSSTKGKDSSKITATITQEGAIEEVMIKDFLAAPVGTAQYKISGVITSVVKADYGNVYVKDASGEVYVYGIGQKGDFAAHGLKEGDIVTLVGPRAEFKGTAQMQNAQYVEHKSVTKMTAAEAMALKDDDKNDPKNYVMLTGKVAKPTAEGAKFDLEKYGNFDLVDESGAAYIYGVSTGWNGETKQFGTLGVKEGDTITLIGYKTSYNGTNEIVAFYVSHESASATTAITIDPADFPSAYSAEDSKITSGGLSLTINNVANYGDGIQMKKGGSYLYINDAIAAGIKTIKINKSATKTWYKDNIKVYAGTAANPETEIELKSADDNGSVYDLSGGNYTYFKIANPSNYAVYMGSIVIE